MIVMIVKSERKNKVREIKFRGLRKDNNEWVYGSLYHFKASVGKTEIFMIIEGAEHTPETGIIFGKRHEVIPETVGQYTGLKDKDGKEIYEGDIVQNWDKGGWVFKSPELQKEYEEYKRITPLGELRGERYTTMCMKCTKYDIDLMEKDGIYVVFWDYSGFIPFYGSEEEIVLQPGLTEVIGNIYKNPELLEYNNEQTV